MRKCPACGNHSMHVRTVVDDSGKVVAVYYDCATCGHTERLR
jgi:hypothetical protein